jgi:hypothetical protein
MHPFARHARCIGQGLLREAAGVAVAVNRTCQNHRKYMCGWYELPKQHPATQWWGLQRTDFQSVVVVQLSRAVPDEL